MSEGVHVREGVLCEGVHARVCVCEGVHVHMSECACNECACE